MLAALAAAPLFTFSSCSDDDDPVNISINPTMGRLSYNADGVWDGWNVNANMDILGFRFSHTFSDEYSTSQGIVAARIKDNDPSQSTYEHQFSAITGGGPEGVGTPYFVACWDVSESEDTPFEQRTCSISYPKNNGSGYETFTPLSMMVTNTCFAYYTMTQGNAYAKKFEEGDHLILQAHGIAPDGREKVLEYYLANCNSAIPSQDWISNTWQRFDLSALGEVTGIYFTMKSTDTGSWGMNTPGYFAFDNFEILAVFD